jgi:two-component system NtrC family sensor kinase
MTQDDSASRQAPAGDIRVRASGVESIVIPDRSRKLRPSIAQILQTVDQARRQTAGYATDEKILRAYVHALEKLYPRNRFAMRLSAKSAERAGPVQHATHRIDENAIGEVSITEAGLVRAGLDLASPNLAEVTLRRKYVPILGAEHERDLPFIDGFDAAICRHEQIVGALCVEFDRRHSLPDNLEEAALITASHVGASLEGAQIQREAIHLRDYLKKLLEHARIPVLVIGRDRGIRVVSGAFEQITGLSHDEVFKKDLLQLAAKTERVRVLAAFVSAMRGRTLRPFVLRLPKAGGGHARLQFKLAPILDSEGRVAGVIAIGQDRTELHELEGQVIQAEKLATLGQLAAGIAHEINNPLTSISVYAEYILGQLTQRGADEADVLRVERILGSADRIKTFTRNLLSYARPSQEEAGDVPLNQVIDEALGFCEHVLREAGVEIQRQYMQGLPEVRGVRTQLHQVFVNLITNACNAAREDGGEIRIMTRLGDDGRLLVTIEDDGVGISEEDLHQIFEPFFSTRRRGKGTGLGLPIVKSILEQHDGSIDIDSSLGQGSCVTLKLRASTDHQP